MDPLAFASLLWQTYQYQHMMTGIAVQNYLSNLTAMNSFAPLSQLTSPSTPQNCLSNLAALNTFSPLTPCTSIASSSPAITELPVSNISSPESMPCLSNETISASSPQSNSSTSPSLPHKQSAFAKVAQIHEQLLQEPPAAVVKSNSFPKKQRPSTRVQKMLWVFILKHLQDESKRHLVEWTNVRSGEFRFVDPDAFARLWGEYKGERKEPMRFDVMTRGLRFYYKKGIVEKVKHQKNLFRFLNVEELKEKLKKL